MTDIPAKSTAMKIDADLIRQLAELLDASNLTEIEVEDGDRRIRVARNIAAAPTHFSHSAAPAAPATEITVPASPVDHPGIVKSPMVGTVYLSAEPDAAPFVREGAPVEPGATQIGRASGRGSGGKNDEETG